MGRLHLSIISIMLICGCAPVAEGEPQQPGLCEQWAFGAPPCNGGPELCERGYDEVAYGTTHNAMSNAADEWLWPNHTHGMKRQLRDGVRALMIDTHYDETTSELTPSLCHGHCALGSIPLDEALGLISDFLRCNRQQVLTLIIEAYVSGDDTRRAFEEAGLLQWTYAHSAGDPWPTLGALIERDQRLVVLSDEGGADDWYMQVWDHAFETPFSVESTDGFRCEMNRGSAENSLFILNHFLSTPLPSPELATAANQNPLLRERALQCREQFGQIPNFVTVDFHEIGNLAEVIEDLNDL